MTSTDQKISIALCTYNGGRFLSEQLESIANQSILPDELLIADDGSDDDTLAIVEAFQKRVSFPVIICVNASRLGSTRNFENVVHRCSGDIIFLADQDDIWCPNKIERSIREFGDNKVGFIFTDADLVDENSSSVGSRLWDRTFVPKTQKLFRKDPAQALVWGGIVTGATMAFRSVYRNLFTPAPDIGIFSHDGWFAFTISLFAEPACIPTPLIKYRIHAGQQIGLRGDSGHPIEKRARNLSKAVDDAAKLSEVVESLAVHYAGRVSDVVDEKTMRNAVSRLEGVKREVLRFRTHVINRRDLPLSVVRRLPTIANELRSGNYSKYANGTRSAFADLVY